MLYGTGHRRLNRETGKMERTTGIIYTIKDGIVFDAKQLLADVRRLVKEQKHAASKQAVKGSATTLE